MLYDIYFISTTLCAEVSVSASNFEWELEQHNSCPQHWQLLSNNLQVVWGRKVESRKVEQGYTK